ncbi:MAG: rhodanese-like domain-containing protein, partial [Ilumatobacteraceae bacterium]
RATMHAAMQHVDRSGHLIVLHRTSDPVLGDGFWANDLQLLGSTLIADESVSLYRRGDRLTVHDLLFEARATIRRVQPTELHHRMHGTEPPLVLDTRTHTDRERFGVIPGSVHVPRTVVEWHFDPANGYLHPAMRSFDQSLVLVCNGGYSSSLAAANLVRLGFTDVADLVGGHTAWAAAGLPVTRPDHSHLDTPSFDEPRLTQQQ